MPVPPRLPRFPAPASRDRAVGAADVSAIRRVLPGRRTRLAEAALVARVSDENGEAA